MKKLKAWMAEHKKFSVIALCLLLMFTCGSAMSAINVSHHRAETAKEQHAGNNTDTTTAAEKKTKEETGKVELTDAQKEIIKGYDTDAKELIDTLSSSVWSVSEGRYTLKFADDSYVETVNGTPTVHSYAISRVEKTSDGYGGYLYTIVFETDTGTHIVTYTDGSGAAVNSDSKTPGENTISTLTSSTMFAQKNTAYERAEAVTNITVKGMNSEVTKLFGGDEKAVTTALSKWCAVHYPSVTEATWQKVVNLDYENGVITTDFKLNDSNSVSVTCVYEQSTGEFSFEGYDHPKLPKGFVTIEQLQGDLDLGDLRDEVEDFDFDGDITEAFGETAEYKVDDNYHALLTWLPDHTEWLEEAEFDGLLEGCKGDIYKMVQMAQYVCFKSDLYDHCEDICRYGTLDQLRDMGVYAIRENLADEILNDLSYDEDYAPTDDAKDTIISAIYATFEEKYGEDFADCADNFIQDNDDIAGRVNPCAMSVETVRAVYGMGFDAVFLNDWKKELAECDIDPEAVSVDSEAHDMENGRDGLDGNAPEKDAPEKDDRDAQPPVDTDNR